MGTAAIAATLMPEDIMHPQLDAAAIVAFHDENLSR
jgi:hypothetical protein